jgi:hypothetical protein
METSNRRPDPPTASSASNASTVPPNNEDAEVHISQELQQQRYGDNEAEHVGFSRHPSWLPEDQQYLKGAAVGPTDSMLALSTITPVTSIPDQDSSHAWNSEVDSNTIVIDTDAPTTGAGDTTIIQATAHLVEDDQRISDGVVLPHVLQCLPDARTPGGRWLCCCCPGCSYHGWSSVWGWNLQSI